MALIKWEQKELEDGTFVTSWPEAGPGDTYEPFPFKDVHVVYKTDRCVRFVKSKEKTKS